MTKGALNTTKRSIKEIISKIAEKIRAEYKPQKIILFGSYAYGEPDEDSDIDLLIIKDTNKSSMDRWMEVRKILRDFNNIIPIPISPLIYTEKELEERREIKDFFIQEVSEKDEVLYG